MDFIINPKEIVKMVTLKKFLGQKLQRLKLRGKEYSETILSVISQIEASQPGPVRQHGVVSGCVNGKHVNEDPRVRCENILQEKC